MYTLQKSSCYKPKSVFTLTERGEHRDLRNRYTAQWPRGPRTLPVSVVWKVPEGKYCTWGSAVPGSPVQKPVSEDAGDAVHIGTRCSCSSLEWQCKNAGCTDGTRWSTWDKKTFHQMHLCLIQRRHHEWRTCSPSSASGVPALQFVPT